MQFSFAQVLNFIHVLSVMARVCIYNTNKYNTVQRDESGEGLQKMHVTE